MAAPRVHGEREENETEKGLRVSDRGFLNTAVLRSRITFIDGEAGGTSTCSRNKHRVLTRLFLVLRYRCLGLIPFLS
jgi:hypothetical protein